jgi:hypothetical protein
MTRWLAAGLVLAAAVTGGCSMLRLGYGHFDTLAAMTADEYFELDPRQREEFTARFARLHEWHRRVELPEYAAFMADAKTRIERGATREDVLWLMGGVEARYRAIVRRGAGDAAVLLTTVTPAQLEVLQRRWERDNRKFAREHRVNGAAAEQRTARVRRMVKQIEEWTGPLSDEQEQRVIALADRMPPAERARHEERLRRQREFLELMAQRGNGEFPARLREWLLDWERGRPPERARTLEEARERRADVYLAVVQRLTPEQRDHLAGRIQGFIGDFTQLAAR